MAKIAGRTKGTPNKLSADAKENVIAVFTRLGGTAAMADWAAENQTEFYKLYAKLLPREISGNVEHKHRHTHIQEATQRLIDSVAGQRTDRGDKIPLPH